MAGSDAAALRTPAFKPAKIRFICAIGTISGKLFCADGTMLVPSNCAGGTIYHLKHCAISITSLCQQNKEIIPSAYCAISTKAQIVAGIVPMAQTNLIWAGLNADVHGAAASLPATIVVMGSHGCGLFGF